MTDMSIWLQAVLCVKKRPKCALLSLDCGVSCFDRCSLGRFFVKLAVCFWMARAIVSAMSWDLQPPGSTADERWRGGDDLRVGERRKDMEGL